MCGPTPLLPLLLTAGWCACGVAGILLAIVPLLVWREVLKLRADLESRAAPRPKNGYPKP
ncbi:MAG: hypothetical protein H3C50_07030 [Kiritimatiellae bacterium]|nr:hypothetical protein [Kiritimatiellia bacterium]MCO5044426.1 hypothetical protein [Kiritimatiellia bacterium]